MLYGPRILPGRKLTVRIADPLVSERVKRPVKRLRPERFMLWREMWKVKLGRSLGPYLTSS